MRTLEFNVAGSTLSKVGDFSNIVRGSKGYLRCHISTEDPDWIGVNTAAVFYKPDGTDIPVAVKGGYADIPGDITDERWFKLKVFGSAKGEHIVSTNAVIISQN